jgi:hypothetical protein
MQTRHMAALLLALKRCGEWVCSKCSWLLSGCLFYSLTACSPPSIKAAFGEGAWPQVAFHDSRFTDSQVCYYLCIQPDLTLLCEVSKVQG